jgi:thiol-disulfide isomerase/thioredoxin
MRFLLTTTIFVFSILQMSADGIKFFQGSWEQALAEAKSQDKLIFMDCYTTWCGPCKAMSNDVFPNSDVGNYYNNNFINVKMDMEKGEGKTLAAKYSVNAYPTLLFIDGNGKVVHMSKGAKPVNDFIHLGKAAMRQNDKSPEYAKLYEEGKREPDFLRKYAYTLRSAKKDYQKVANEYLATQTDLTTATNLKFLFDLTNVADSRIFNLMVKHKAGILKQGISEEDFNNKVIMAATNTVLNAVDLKSTALVQEAKSAVKSSVPAAASEFAAEADMIYYSGIGDEAKFMKSAAAFTKKFAKNNAFKLDEIAKMVIAFCKEESSFKQAEKWALKAIENGGQADYHLTYAKLLAKQNKKSEALQAARQGKNVAQQAKQSTAAFDVFIKQLDEKA